MFKTLFVKNGVKHDNVLFTFRKGITAITGPNGCGKSLLAEFMAFALFGVKALRLPAEKYKGLQVDAEIIIKNKTYTISRNTSNCTISNEGVVVCHGTKACNLKIIELLGYNYSVYKMGNYAAQFEITEFGKLTPTERKKAVDQVLGLTILDTLIKYTNEEGNKHLSEARGMENVLVKPIEPVKPEGVDEEETIRTQLKSIQTIIDRRNLLVQLKASIGQLTIPVVPTEPEGKEGMSSEDIKNILSKKKLLDFQIGQLTSIVEPKYTEDQLKAIEDIWPSYDLYMEYETKISLMPKVKPEIGLREALDGLVQWNKVKEWNKAKQEIITCPNCSTQFNRSGEILGECPEVPSKDETYYQEQVDLNHIWENIEVPKEVAKVDKPLLARHEIVEQRRLISKWEEKNKTLPDLIKERLGYEKYTDQLFLQVQAYEYAIINYQEKLKQYNEYTEKLKSYNQELEQLKALGDIDTILDNLNNKFTLIQIYRAQYEDYKRAEENYNERYKYLETIKDKGERYKQASEKLKDIKVKMKQYILPSLAKMASHLLSEMSEGQYNSVEIDDNFNITINGLEIVGYSGSEQAMANLAVRVALGQVLTHKSFDVFIGDEIDDSMRPERAQATADCLKKLSKHIGQIILISHRDIEADNYINLGEK